MDDILIYSPSEEEHEEHLRVVLEFLSAHWLYAKFGKCEFWLGEMKFLGHVVSREGESVDTSKVEAVQDWAQPKSVFEFRSILGFVGY